jgi:hypothetical protein
MMKHLTSALTGMLVILFASLAFPCTACAQNQHASFFNGGTTLTATCTNTSGALISSDAFLGTLQGNTTVTLPASAIGCVDRDVIDIRATQATSQAYTLTVNAGTGTVTKILSNSGSVIAMPSAGAVTSVVLHQIWVYNSVAGTPQWELVTQETNPATSPPCSSLSNAAASCSTDTTSASNISSGTLAVARGGTGDTTGLYYEISAGPDVFGSNTSYPTGVQIRNSIVNPVCHFTNLLCLNVFHAATCTTAPKVNVFAKIFAGATSTGTALQCDNTLDGVGGGANNSQTLSLSGDFTYGLEIDTQGGTCTTDKFVVVGTLVCP